MPKFDAPITTTYQNLDRVLANPLPVMLVLTNGSLDSGTQTALADVARVEAGNMLVAKLDASESPAARKRFNINGNSVLVAWKDNAELTRVERLTPTTVQEAAEYLVGKGPAPKPVESQPESNNHPITVNEATFNEQVLQSEEPVLVDFWAPWCGPCRMIAPTLEKFAGEYAGRLRIAKLNVDENPRLAAQYHAHSIPLLVLFKDGKAVQQVIGAHPEPSLRNFVEKALS